MEHVEYASPKECNRRSIFESDEDSFQIPDTKCKVTYPVEYIEKVTTEIGEWRMHVTNVLEEKQKMRNEREKLENTVLDESILSAEQQDFFKSLKFDEYMRRAKDFCARVQILEEKMKYKLKDDIEKKCLAVQSKLAKDVLEKHFKQ